MTSRIKAALLIRSWKPSHLLELSLPFNPFHNTQKIQAAEQAAQIPIHSRSLIPENKDINTPA
jgi:hypothetical protein